MTALIVIPESSPVTDGNRCRDSQLSTGLSYRCENEEKEEGLYEHGGVKIMIGKPTETADRMWEPMDSTPLPSTGG